MITSVPGEFYIFEADTLPSHEELTAFFQDLISSVVVV